MEKKMSASWFYHDNDMRNDIKIKALRRKFGLEGYAVYNCLLEMLSAEDWFQLKFDEVNVELYAADLDIEGERFLEIVTYCVKLQLFSLNSGTLISEALKRRFESLVELKEKRSLAGKAGMASRWGNNSKPVNETKKQKRKQTEPRFKIPTPEEVQAYCNERNNGISGQAFCDFYESKGWMVGSNKMKSWKGAVRTWENKRRSNNADQSNSNLGVGEYIATDGRRTYGDGRYAVPMEAPPRPSTQDIWDSANQRWIVL